MDEGFSVSVLKNAIVMLLILSLTACSVLSRSKVSPTAPSSESTNVQLGLAYLQGGDIQRAKQKLLLAEQKSPQSVETQGAMGYFFEATGNLPAGEAHYRKAISVDPKSGAAQNNYGAFLCRQGRYGEADQHFLLALQDPNYLDTARIYENAGLCAMRVPNIEKAREYFIHATERDPARAMAWLELGQIAYQQKNYLQVQQYLDHYMQLTKDPTPDALWLGAVLARALDDENTAGRYILMLQTRFPGSERYHSLMNTPKTASKQQKKQLYY